MVLELPVFFWRRQPEPWGQAWRHIPAEALSRARHLSLLVQRQSVTQVKLFLSCLRGPKFEVLRLVVGLSFWSPNLLRGGHLNTETEKINIFGSEKGISWNGILTIGNWKFIFMHFGMVSKPDQGSILSTAYVAYLLRWSCEQALLWVLFLPYCSIGWK